MRMNRNGRIAAAAALMAIGLVGASAGTGQAASGSQRAGGYTAAATHAAATGENMAYGGGPVQLHPVVYLVFWGSQWNTDTNGIPAYLTSMFKGLGTSSDNWSTITSQYTNSNGQGPTFNGAVLGGVWMDNAKAEPTNPSANAVANEGNRGASHFGVSGNGNAQIVVLSAHGTHPDGWPTSGFCAYHDYTGTVSYTNMPYQLDAPAGSRCPNGVLGGRLDAFSIVEGHEYAESVTDPQAGDGWVAPNGEEIGDQCESGFQKVTLSTGTFAMQPIWSNKAGGCVIHN
jgi:serine protease